MLSKLNEKVQQVLSEISLDSPRKWGVMEQQHMIEHLAGVFAHAYGKFGIPFSGDEEEAAMHKTNFFNSQYPFPRRVPLPKDEVVTPPELKAENLNAAKAMLKQSYQEFLAYYNEHPEDQHPHPFFNLLDYDEWVEFHIKHIDHHMMQFSVIQEPEGVV